MTTTPASVTYEILGNCSHCFAYPFQLESQAEWMVKNFFGSDGWLLLPKDRRRQGFFTSDNDMNMLPTYSYLYKKDTQFETSVYVND